MRRELKPVVEQPDFPITHRNIAGPLRAKDPEKMGDIDLICPHCGAVLAEGLSEEGVRGIQGSRCYECDRWSVNEQAAPPPS